jgi:hypothetical protein
VIDRNEEILGMTTNVFCKKSNVLASDSRWSFKITDQIGDTEIRSTAAIAYVDDTGYDKICYDRDTGYIFAGPGLVIESWKNWVASPDQDSIKRPAVALDFSMCMVDLESSEIIDEHGQKVRDTNCRMAGTGAKHAYSCWAVNQNAELAVKSAIKSDFFSGGEVKTLHGSNISKSRISLSLDFSLINQQFLQRGKVMYASNQHTIPLSQAAMNDPRIQSLVNRVASGQSYAEAPSGYDSVVWTPADEQRLDAALEKRAEKRRLSAVS